MELEVREGSDLVFGVLLAVAQGSAAPVSLFRPQGVRRRGLIKFVAGLKFFQIIMVEASELLRRLVVPDHAVL